MKCRNKEDGKREHKQRGERKVESEEND